MRRREGDAADDDAGQTVRSTDGDRAGGRLAGVTATGQTLFVDRGLACCTGVAIDRDNARRTVGVAVDGDGQRRGAGVAVRIGNRVGIGLGQRLTRLQGVHRRVGVVEGVAVAAVGIELEAAVAEDDRAGRRGDRVGRDVGTDIIVVEDVSAQGIRRCVFTDRPAVGLGYRHAVDNEDIQAGAGGSAGAGGRDRDTVGRRAGTRLIDRTIERIGICKSPRSGIVAGQGQGALAGIDELWRTGQTGELARCQGRPADGDAGQSARCAHRDGAGDRFAGVSRAEQPALAHGRLPGIDGVDVIGNHGRRRIAIVTATGDRVIQNAATRRAELEVERIDVFDDAQQAHEGRSAVGSASSVAGGRFLKQFVEAAAFVDRFQDPVDIGTRR